MRALFVALFLLSAPALASADIINEVFKCTKNPCVVKDNRGGNIIPFEAAAKEIAKRGWTLIINGDCYSACVIAADNARGAACITERAVFHFHKAFTWKKVTQADFKVVDIKTNLQDPPHALDLMWWNYEQGGYPVDGFNRMNYPEARKFWKTCNFPFNGRGLY